ncbi:hypothetical protein WICANDRAFT_76975 [Wickerhamomyces anomalus NRRL Y-366-8]|uniref:Uncharacterized protein n=1 Tax=Wickerhamomyces anomalus (strain ATCC 58044 / CBS 1984 / NCYC 433 / NRRL Y-366-8) TaxID=683960 RepID=A0A1E3PC63_WICAA|nr:uncharacterized protein WICANDRAFT_76975 [Wickerhamomyces anomalus NRRL Y-366-8]ODQ62814.1 hypothetical protein WICANDRAFT_76975 [Wickerhamomyces anomalus NRRL Y-366-8]
MAVFGVKGPRGKVVEKLFQKVIELVKQDADTNIIWLEDTGTIPFQSLALNYDADEQILSRIQYIRVFDLEGYIDSFKEIKCKSVLVLSHFGAMCKDRVYQDETPRGNALGMNAWTVDHVTRYRAVTDFCESAPTSLVYGCGVNPIFFKRLSA